VGTLSGSVPQDGDVVTPPVAFGDTEQGIPCRLNVGSVGAALPDCVVPGTELAELPSCAWTGTNAASPPVIARTKTRMKRRFIALSIAE
jgi:hypothetical protein